MKVPSSPLTSGILRNDDYGYYDGPYVSPFWQSQNKIASAGVARSTQPVEMPWCRQVLEDETVAMDGRDEYSLSRSLYVVSALCFTQFISAAFVHRTPSLALARDRFGARLTRPWCLSGPLLSAWRHATS